MKLEEVAERITTVRKQYFASRDDAAEYIARKAPWMKASAGSVKNALERIENGDIPDVSFNPRVPSTQGRLKDAAPDLKKWYVFSHIVGILDPSLTEFIRDHYPGFVPNTRVKLPRQEDPKPKPVPDRQRLNTINDYIGDMVDIGDLESRLGDDISWNIVGKIRESVRVYNAARSDIAELRIQMSNYEAQMRVMMCTLRGRPSETRGELVPDETVFWEQYREDPESVSITAKLEYLPLSIASRDAIRGKILNITKKRSLQEALPYLRNGTYSLFSEYLDAQFELHELTERRKEAKRELSRTMLHLSYEQRGILAQLAKRE